MKGPHIVRHFWQTLILLFVALFTIPPGVMAQERAQDLFQQALRMERVSGEAMKSWGDKVPKTPMPGSFRISATRPNRWRWPGSGWRIFRGRPDPSRRRCRPPSFAGC